MKFKDEMHLYPPSSSIGTTFDSSIPWTSFLIVYSIPIFLILTIGCIIKWRPLREFPTFLVCLKWYLTCSPKKVMKEMERTDRAHMILSIDAQSLASMSSSTCDSTLLMWQGEDDQERFDTTAIP